MDALEHTVENFIIWTLTENIHSKTEFINSIIQKLEWLVIEVSLHSKAAPVVIKLTSLTWFKLYQHLLLCHIYVKMPLTTKWFLQL